MEFYTSICRQKCFQQICTPSDLAVLTCLIAILFIEVPFKKTRNLMPPSRFRSPSPKEREKRKKYISYLAWSRLTDSREVGGRKCEAKRKKMKTYLSAWNRPYQVKHLEFTLLGFLCQTLRVILVTLYPTDKRAIYQLSCVRSTNTVDLKRSHICSELNYGMIRRLSYVCVAAVVFITFIMLWNEYGAVKKPLKFRRRGRKKDGVGPGKISVIGGSSLASNADYDEVNTFVVFIGYPRSGHTLVSSLIDAHPHAIIANEFDIIGRWVKWKPEQRNKYFLFDQLYKNSREESKTGFRSTTAHHMYSYAVPSQWQGRFKDTLKVIGAKKGGKTTRQLTKQKRSDIMDSITKALNVKFRFLHVVRNPYDNIATMLLRTKKKRIAIKNNGRKFNNTQALEIEIIKYFDLATRNQLLAGKYKNSVLEVQGTNLIRKPKETLKRVCKFLGLSCSQKYLKDCAKIIFKSPSKTRHNVVWTSEQKKKIKATMKRYSFFKDYSFET